MGIILDQEEFIVLDHILISRVKAKEIETSDHLLRGLRSYHAEYRSPI
jgi:hypothetical protein